MGGKIALTYSGLPPLLLREASLLFAPLGWFEKRKQRVVKFDFNSESDFRIE